jgi:hydrogenase maturation factor HypF (carbamoyltransferase family)
MSKNEKCCPECEEEMKPIFDKAKVLTFWECTECGTRIPAAKKA